MKFLVLTITLLIRLSLQEENHHWALELASESLNPTELRAFIDELQDKYHLIHKGKVGILDDVHQFHLAKENLKALREKHDLEEESSDEQVVGFVHGSLGAHNAVKGHHYQTPRQRSKRTVVFNDPEFKYQWHLVNTKTVGHDMDVQKVWSSGVTGTNVTVCVIDDGLDHSNRDIQPNYNHKGSYDFIDDDDDPMPLHKLSENHGTKCGGVIAAAANNSFCGIGIAYGASVSGVRILDNTVTDVREAEAFSYKLATNHIFSNSWGPNDDSKTVDGPGPLAQRVLEKATTKEGRCGYGSIYVVASGNGGGTDNCNFDGYANSMYTVTVGSISEDNQTPYYSERCTTTLGVTYSSGSGSNPKITTTDLVWHQEGCALKDGGLTGTSASAPMAAGMIALMLDARWCLTWRDVQFIIVLTSSVIDHESGWSKNAAGLMFHSYHGFGLMKASKMVNAAKVWKSVPRQEVWSSGVAAGAHRSIPSSKPLHVNISVPRLEEIKTLEYVTIDVTVTHSRRGDLEVVLTSPRGTVSTVASPRRYDKSADGFKKWKFTTVQFWGEPPEGDWLVKITDTGKPESSRGSLDQFQFFIYGSSLTSEELKERKLLVENTDGSPALQCPSKENCKDEMFSDLTITPPASFWSLYLYKIMIVLFLLGVASVLIIFIVVEVYKKNKWRFTPIRAIFHRGKTGNEESAFLLEEDGIERNDNDVEFDVRGTVKPSNGNEIHDDEVEQVLYSRVDKDISPAIGTESQILELATREPNFGVNVKEREENSPPFREDGGEAATVVPRVAVFENGRTGETEESVDIESL